MTIKTANPLGLDASIPTDGRASDAYAVADTATLLVARVLAHRFDRATEGWHPRTAARHATQLHRISGWLHRLAERACNEDLTCRECQGEGLVNESDKGQDKPCKACAGTGRTTGRREARLEAAAREIAEHYGLRVYFQTDPRGCALWIVDPDTIPPASKLRNEEVFRAEVYRSFSDEALRREWISCTYTRGHAVARLGV